MIEMINISKEYSSNVVALNNININIKRGEFVFLIGHSGAGKSTFLKLILKEEVPSSGKLIIDGEDVTYLHNRVIPNLRKKIGVVFQDFRLLPRKNVYENVAFAMEIVGSENKDIRREVPIILSLVGLSHKAKMYPYQLSGGEKQRVSIARAIINKPPILICDEPTGNLDPENTLEIMDLLKQINKRSTTILMATHDQDIVNSMNKRVITLDNGYVSSDIEKGRYN